MFSNLKEITVRELARSSKIWFIVIAFLLVYPVFLQNFDSEVYSFGAPYIISKINVSELYIGLTASGYTAGIVVFSLFGGYLFDRVSPKGAVLIGLAIFSAFSGLTGIASDSLELVIFRILDGVGVSIFQVSIASYLGDLFPSRRGKMLSLYILLGGLGLFAGPFIVAPFTNDIKLPFALAGIFGLIAVILFLFLIPTKFKKPGEMEAHKFSLKALINRNVLLAAGSVGFFGVALFAEVSYVPLYFDDVLKFSSLYSTIAVSAFGIGAFVLAIPMGFISDKYGRKPLLIIFSIIQVLAGLVLFATRPDFVVATSMNFLWGAGWGIYFMNLVAIAQDSVPEETVGISVGMIYTTFNIGAIFGGPLMGSLILVSWTLAGVVSISVISLFTLAFVLFIKEDKTKLLKKIKTRATEVS